jgi:DNA-binding CsgD family transcriptional regulator
MGFAAEGGKTITAGDITTLTGAGYALADIATALGVTETQLNSISSYVAPTDLQTALSDMGFAAEGGKTITAGDITSLTGAGYALADIATALGVTETQLNSISSYVPPTDLQTALSGMGFTAEGGKTITAGDITTLTGAGYALADIATALGVTEGQLNSISSYTAPAAAVTAVNELLIAAGFGGEGRTITSDDVAGWKTAVANQSVYTLGDIAAAFDMSETELLAIDTSGEATGGLLENNGYYLGGSTDGMADQVPATIGGEEPARLSDGEFVVPADVVSHLGNGNSQAGSEQLYSMMDRVRKERTGTTMQGAQINPMQQLPA